MIAEGVRPGHRRPGARGPTSVIERAWELGMFFANNWAETPAGRRPLEVLAADPGIASDLARAELQGFTQFYDAVLDLAQDGGPIDMASDSGQAILKEAVDGFVASLMGQILRARWAAK